MATSIKVLPAIELRPTLKPMKLKLKKRLL